MARGRVEADPVAPGLAHHVDVVADGRQAGHRALRQLQAGHHVERARFQHHQLGAAQCPRRQAVQARAAADVLHGQEAGGAAPPASCTAGPGGAGGAARTARVSASRRWQ